MFQNNPNLRRKFLIVNVASGLIGLFLTFILRDILGSKFFLIAITWVSGFVLLIWILMIFDKDSYYPRIAIKNSATAISIVMLFLAIQYFLIDIVEERIAKYLDQAAINYCEQIGEISEEYKILNGEYPSWQTMDQLDGKPRQPFLIDQQYDEYDYYKKDNDRNLYIHVRPSCSYHYRMEPPGAFKTYFIPEKEWTYSWKR